jgi:hypothetical protein
VLEFRDIEEPVVGPEDVLVACTRLAVARTCGT